MCGQAAWRDTGRRRRGQNLCCQVRLSSSGIFQTLGREIYLCRTRRWSTVTRFSSNERKNLRKTKQKYFLLLCFDLQYFSPETEIVLNISYNKHKAYQLLQVINQIYWPMTEYWSLLLANESSVLVSRGCYQSLSPPAHYCPPILGNNIITTIHCQQNSYLQLYLWRCLALFYVVLITINNKTITTFKNTGQVRQQTWNIIAIQSASNDE